MLISRWQVIAGLVSLCCVPAAWGQVVPVQPGPIMARPPAEILPRFLQDQLKLTDEQKKKLAEMQKDVEVNLTKLLTPEQKKTLDAFRQGKGFPGPVFFPPGGGGPIPPGGVPGGPGPKFGGPGPGFGGPMGDIKKTIGATDEEWKVIGPKVQKVTSLRRAVNGEGGSASPALTHAQAELKTVLDEPKHTKAEVDEKLTAVRKAREQARADLTVAQRDLMQMLTPSQQAVMVSLGFLE
jgi:Spy/CpxP family protein refolding chaperone